jgi:hypothetical protein
MKKLFKKKTFKLTLLIVALLVLAAGILFGMYRMFFDSDRLHYNLEHSVKDDAYDNEIPETLLLDDVLTREQAIQDMEFMLKCLKVRHPATLYGIPDSVQAQYDKEIAAFKNNVTVLELYQASSRVLSLMRDSYTFIKVEGQGQVVDGIRFLWEDGSMTLEDTGSLEGIRNESNGARVIAINNISIENLYETHTQTCSYTSDTEGRMKFADCIVFEKFLRLLGVDTSQGIDITVEGIEQPYHYVIAEQEHTVSTEERAFVYYEINEEKGLGILTVDDFIDSQEYTWVVRRFFTEVRDKGIKHIALDLRASAGDGESFFGELMGYMPVETFNLGWHYERYEPWLIKIDYEKLKNTQYVDFVYSGDIYVLTSVDTYGMAAALSSVLKYNGLAAIVGQQSAESYRYGLSWPSSMPNSQLHVYISNVEFFIGGKAGFAAYAVPDYLCPPREALDKVYELIAE